MSASKTPSSVEPSKSGAPMPQFVSIGNFTRPDAPWSALRRERIARPPERVWRALTDPRELAAWWCDEADLDLRPGGRCRFGGPRAFGGGRRVGEPAPECRILELSAPERLVLRWPIGGIETVVRYELAGRLDETDLSVVQTAPRSPGWDDDGDAPNLWWVALPALRSYLEDGRADLRIDFDALERGGEMAFELDVFTFPWVIWSKLTLPRELDRWWGRGAEVELAPDGAFRLGALAEGPSRILELAPERRLRHDWRWKNGAASEIEWSIEETDAATRVGIRDTQPLASGRPLESIALRWAAHLLDLKRISQRGISPREFQGG
jgi:uncharacterized protein YndB with AHSA1/START domain